MPTAEAMQNVTFVPALIGGKKLTFRVPTSSLSTSRQHRNRDTQPPVTEYVQIPTESTASPIIPDESPFPPEPPAIVTLLLECPRDLFGAIIGRQGKRIKSILQETGTTQIIIPTLEDPNSQYIKILGNEDSANMAKTTIERLIQTELNRRNSPTHF